MDGLKNLASCNKTTRDKALRYLLTNWLPSQLQVSDDDMKKLWKGLFYCLWHADKPLNQSDLIDSLSSLLLNLHHLPLSIHYLSVFFLTMRREWPGMDSYRLDKFYLLIRRFLHCFILLLKKNNWDLGLTDNLMRILEENAFFADDKFQGNGVNYHIAAVFLEELKQFLPIRAETLEIMFRPFFAVMGKSQDKVLVGKTKCNVFDVLLKMGKSLLQMKKKKLVDGDDNDDVGDEAIVNLGTVGLAMGFAAKFYQLGSSPDCFQGNRKVLFGLHEEFLKLEKDLASSRVEISMPVVEIDDEDEVPKLIPVVLTSETEASDREVTSEAPEFANKSSKKKKKDKKGSDVSNKKPKRKNLISLSNENKNENENADANENENVIPANGENFSDGLEIDGDTIIFNESVISNLQKQFEKVAAQAGSDEDGTSSFFSPRITVKGAISKKRKRARSTGGRESRKPDLSGEGDAGGDAADKTSEKSAKKVRFSIKNNLVWKPHSPLPPQDLRLPASVTPRGSALKKGIPPGPIRQMPPAVKKVKQKKKSRKGIKPIPPAIKRLRKLQALPI